MRAMKSVLYMFQRQCYLRKALMQPVPFNDIKNA